MNFKGGTFNNVHCQKKSSEMGGGGDADYIMKCMFIGVVE